MSLPLPNTRFSRNSESGIRGAYCYGFNGKDRESEFSSGAYDFGARIHDARLGRWLSVDPLAYKFPELSAFVFCANNSLNCIDPDGRDIIVLNYGYTEDPEHWNNHAVGHQAVLIGNDKDGWTYYSYDYDEGVNGRPNITAENMDDNFTAGVHFSSLKEFANSEHNTFKDNYDDGKGLETAHKDENGQIIQRYQEGFRIVTDAETDKAMKKAANSTFDEEYSIPKGNECTSVPRNALRAGGLNDGEDIYEGNDNDWDGTFEENSLPTNKQKSIEDLNKGIDVDNQLIPQRGGAGGTW